MPGDARASADDPFAIDKTLTLDKAVEAEREGPGLSAIVVDGEELRRMVELKWIGDDLAISSATAEAAGLPLKAGQAGFVKLADIEIARFTFDRVTQRLTVKKYRKGDGPNDVNVAQRNFDPGKKAPLLAAILDYSLTAGVSGDRTTYGAFFAPRVSYGDFTIGGTVTYQSDPGPQRGSLTRLDTTATLALPQAAMLVRVGDAVSSGSDAQRALRVGGIQIGTDYNLRPDIITAPLPEFAGQVAIPTTVDLIVNDRRFEAARIEAGDFKVHNIPMALGRGEVSVVLQDELGREVVQTAQFYVVPGMLDKGLTEWGVTAGWIRRRYGSVSNDYHDPVGTFFMRRGLTKSLSAGVSGELGMGVVNLGGHVQSTIANLALAYGELRYSHTAEGSGALIKAGLESSGRGISGRIETLLPTKGYRDVAGVSGDGQLPRQYVAAIDFDLGKTVRAQLSATRQTRDADISNVRPREAATVLRAAARWEFNDRMTLAGDLGYRRNTFGDEFTAGLSLNIRFGSRASGLASIRKTQNQSTTGQVSYFRPDTEVGQVGYAAHAYLSENNQRFAGTLAYRAPFARVSTDAEYASGRLAARARVDGSIVVADGGVFAMDRSSEAYALVRTGDVEGVTVTHEHREVGKSDKSGRLLVARVTPLVPAQFDIAPEKLPAGAVARSTYHRMQASRGGVVLVDMDIEAYRSILMRVVDRSGQPLEVGSRVVALPSGREYMVAFDGLIDFNALSRDEYLVAKDGDADECRSQLPHFEADSFEMTEVSLPCASEVATFALND